MTDPFTRRSRERSLTRALAAAQEASESLTTAVAWLDPDTAAERRIQAARLTLYPAIDLIRHQLAENRKKEL